MLVPELIGGVPSALAAPSGAVVQRRVTGSTLGTDEHTVVGPRLARQVASAVAALHQLPPQILAGRVPGLAEWREQVIDITEVALPATPGFLPAAESVVLDRWWEMFGAYLHGIDPAGAVPVHGDLWQENMLTRDGQLTAVLDWETCGLGDRAVDLAGLWYLDDRFGSQILDHYQHLPGHRDAQLPDRVGWFRVARELTGVAWSVRHHDDAALAESTAKLRGVLHTTLNKTD